MSIRGFQRGGFVRGGKISIIGVVRAPVAIINFASNLCESLWVYKGFNKETPHKKSKINYCNRCEHPPHLLRFPPLAKPPFGNPQVKILDKQDLTKQQVWAHTGQAGWCARMCQGYIWHGRDKQGTRNFAQDKHTCRCIPPLKKTLHT